MSEFRGLKRFINLDGEDFEATIKNPQTTAIDAPPVLNPVPTQKASVIFSRFLGAGNSLVQRQLTFALSFPTPDEDAIAALEDLLESAVLHELTLWKNASAVYVARAGQTTFYLPRCRRHAPEVLSQYTVEHPLRAFLNDVEQTVAFENGPDVSLPTAGNVIVARNAYTSGTNLGSAALRTPALSAGDVLRIRYCPLHLVYETGNSKRMHSVAEEIELTFMEI